MKYKKNNKNKGCYSSIVATNRKVYIEKLSNIFMRTEVIVGLIFVSIFIIALASSSVEAGPAIVKTVVETNGCPLIADGTTEYEMNVYLDNTPLNGEPTQGMDWALSAPQGADMTITRVAGNSGNPPVNDFFAGRNMFFELVTRFFNNGQTRIATGGQGASNRQGNVATYWFTINSVQRPMGANFDLWGVAVYKDDGQATLQNFVEDHQRFYILPNNFPVMSAKCRR